MPDFASRGDTDAVYLQVPSEAYRHFRIIFPYTRIGENPLYSENLAVAEIELLGEPLDQSLRILRFTADHTDLAVVRPISLTWSSLPGQSYSLQWSGNGSTWNTWFTGIASGGYLSSFDFDDPPNIPSRLHRVVEE